MKMNKLCSNLDQSNPSTGGFTDEEKQTMRNNIGAAAASDIPSDIPSIIRRDTYSGGTEYELDNLLLDRQSIDTAVIKSGATKIGSTVPAPSLNSDEGKVPVAYYRDGRGYFLLKKYKDDRFPDSSSSDVGKVLTVNPSGNAIWDNVGGGSSISMSSFREFKTIHIPSGNSSMVTDLYTIKVLPAKTAINMTVIVRDMNRHSLAMMGISINCGGVSIDGNSFTRGTSTSIAHALPICYYNDSNSSINIQIGFGGTFAEEDLTIEMMGFTITQFTITQGA